MNIILAVCMLVCIVRVLSHKSSINFNDWFGSYNAINGCINHFITQIVVHLYCKRFVLF